MDRRPAPGLCISSRGADGTLAPPGPPALPRQLCAPDPSPQHTRSRGRLSSDRRQPVCGAFTWRAAVTSGVRGGTLERGTGESCDWGLESKCRSSEVQTSALTPALHGRVLTPGGPSVGTHTSTLMSSSRRASSPRRPLLPVLASRDKDPRERCPCVNPLEQLENAFGTVRPWKEQREFLVKASAWRCYRIWLLLRHRVFTQPHTARLQEAGLSAPLA